MSREVVVVSGVRTPIGTFGGSLKDIAPTELAAQVVRESLKRASVDGAEVGHVVFGQVVGVHIDDRFIVDGLLDTAAMKPIARCGYDQYAVVESLFSMRRPTN